MLKRDVERRLKLRQVLTGLVRMYGAVKTPAVRRGGGLDTLVEAMLSQNTNMPNARAGYRMLRRRFATWAEVMDAPVADVQREIAICGLARMRARRLQAMLRTIKEDRGRLSIDHLAKGTVEAGFEYLMGFFGIGPKTAAFTLLFAFGLPVLPVDNGVLRVVRRLKLVRAKARDLEVEETLSPLIAKGKHYPTHILLFRHAKERCRPKNPKCGECALLKLCPYGQRRVKHRPGDVGIGVVEAKEKAKRLAKYVSAGLRKYDDEAIKR